MVSFLISLAILFVVIFVGVAVYFIVFHKYPGFPGLENPNGEGGSCMYDADCPINPDGTALRCINSYPPAGSTAAKQGTCTAYCVEDLDCSYGNPIGQTPRCVSNPNNGQKLCTLQVCSENSDCATGEGCVALTQGASQKYCAVLGNNPTVGTSYISQSIPCAANECFGFTGNYTPIKCLKGAGTPEWGVGCIYNNDCSAGIPCSTGCYPSATSTTESQQAGCPQPEDKSTSTLKGTCGDVPFSSSAWPIANSGYCVQTCAVDTDCPTGLGCTNGACIAT